MNAVWNLGVVLGGLLVKLGTPKSLKTDDRRVIVSIRVFQKHVNLPG